MSTRQTELIANQFFQDQAIFAEQTGIFDSTDRIAAAYQTRSLIGAVTDSQGPGGETLPHDLRQYARNCRAEFRDAIGVNEYRFATASGTGTMYGDYKGQLCIPYRHHLKIDPAKAYKGAQLTGDCHVAGTMVLMADTSEKAIESVAVGEMVIDRYGISRRVVRTIAKPYSGPLVTIRAIGNKRSITSTPDHKFATKQGWTPIADLLSEPLLLNYDGEFCHASLADKSQSDPVETNVYCLEIEDEPSFIANGYVVHNCVSWSKRSMRDHARCFDIGHLNEAEEYVKRSATADLYSMRGHTGAGASPSRIALAATKIGILLEMPVESDSGEVWDFSEYRDYYKLGMRYGRTGFPQWIYEANAEFGPKQVAEIDTEEELLTALWNGCGVGLGSMMGVSKTGGKDGVAFLSSLSGSWAHDMQACGFDDTRTYHRETLIFVDQSWGKWQTMPVSVWPKEYGVIPEGMFALTLTDYMRHVRSGECHALSDSVGFRPRRQATLGAEGLI